MSHLGSFVPSEKALIGLVDRIFSRIHSRETIAVNQSTFMIDTRQLAVMVKHCTEKSLLLIDEYGKGTNVGDGIGLLGGVIKRLVEREEECPKAIICKRKKVC